MLADGPLRVKGVRVLAMIRRSFRIGLKLGLLAGIAFALVKTLQSRRPPEDLPATGAASWPPLDPTPHHEPAVATPKPEPAPKVEERGWLEPQPEPAPVTPAAAKPPIKKAAKKAAAKKAAIAAWVEPTAGVCPTSHPVKAKLASKIFHLPGMLNYERTAPDRCYHTAEVAEADGLRAAKR